MPWPWHKRKEVVQPAEPVTLPPVIYVLDPVLEAMSIDELIEYKQNLQGRIEKIRQEKLRAHAVYTRKVIEWHARRVLRQAGLEDIVLTPGPAVLRVKAPK